MSTTDIAAEEILDTHLHLVDRSRLDYPWLANEPALNRDWSLQTYAQEARRVGVTRAIFMEVDVADPEAEAEITWVEEQAATGAFPLAGIIASCRPESPTSPPHWTAQRPAR